MSKITCEYAQANLMAYLKNGLPTAERRTVAGHLATCNTCAQALQEAKALEAELWAQAVWHRPNLPPEASLRIQKQVYRRMRRALFIQRTLSFFQMAGAVITAVLLFGGALLFGNQWVAFLATTPTADDPQPTAVPTVISEQSTVNSEEIVPTAVPNLQSPISQSPNLLTSPTPHADPTEVAQAVMNAALTGDVVRLSELFGAMRSSKEPTLRMWRQFGERCGSNLTADSLIYKAVPIRPGITVRVEIYQNGRFIGDLKVRLINDEWFTFFAPIPSVANCQFAAGHSPFTDRN